LSNESKTSPSNFLVGLNAQSTRCDILKFENERGGKLYGLLIIWSHLNCTPVWSPIVFSRHCNVFQ
jgi:hypothetical protein